MDLSSEEITLIVAQAPPTVAALLSALLLHVTEQQQLLAQCDQTIAALTARIQELADQLNRTSRNSHQPPASDGFKKQPRSLRQRSGKRPGGQTGHAGQTLRFAAQPDEIIVHRPSHCADCGAALADLAVVQRQRRQVVDLPPLALRTIEHQVETICCAACQALSSAQFPPEATEAVQYGPQIKALAVYLRSYQLLPSARTAELLTDLFGAAPSEGTLDTALGVAATALAPVVERIRAAVIAAPVVHFDETGCYVEDKRWWLHVACTAALTYYFVHRRRGQGGSSAAGVLPEFKGIALHDCYAPYWEYSCRHALCNAHILRELAFLALQPQQEWAGALAALLREMLAATNAGRAGGRDALAAAQTAAFVLRYDALVAVGLAANPLVPRPPQQRRGQVKQSKATNLLLRLREHGAEVLRFVHDLRVAFDNNQAERDIRMMKVQQKISGRFRTAGGATAFCRIRSYISTLRKQGLPVLAALEQAFRGTPLLPAVLG